MTWLTLALASAFFFALAAILQRVLMKDDKSDPVAYAFVFQFLIALMFLPMRSRPNNLFFRP